VSHWGHKGVYMLESVVCASLRKNAQTVQIYIYVIYIYVYMLLTVLLTVLESATLCMCTSWNHRFML